MEKKGLKNTLILVEIDVKILNFMEDILSLHYLIVYLKVYICPRGHIAIHNDAIFMMSTWIHIYLQNTLLNSAKEQIIFFIVRYYYNNFD